MDNPSRQYFLYGGLFSLLFSSLLLLGMFWLISKNKHQSHFTQTDNIIVTISLDTKKVIQMMPDSQDEPVEKLQEDELEDLDDLFDSIDSEEIVYSKKTVVKDNKPKIDNEFLKKVQTRKNIKHENTAVKKRNISKTISLEQSKFKTENKAQSQSGGEKNIYYAKIQNILYQNWQQPSLSFQQSKVMITISASGKMRYSVKQVSGDVLFDEALKAHLEYLLDTIFPISPDGLPITFETYFKSKEQ